MNSRRALFSFLTVLALFLVGTLVVLSSISCFLAIDPAAYLLEQDLSENITPNTSTQQHIPRIIHQTWKTDSLPPRWQTVSRACRAMMPDYEYMLWTDASSREFIAAQYPWFLDTFDNYRYPIQRADAIRYFVLYHYGGVYMDLDIGCRRPIDPLLVYPVILPKTIPVGVSNDLMFAEQGHPFLKQTIESLKSFDHSWLLNYPTVMFSTGPMFLSVQYGLYARENPHVAMSQVRILPKPLYGKNIKPSEAPRSFFTHFYASSWHDDDAAFIAFLNTWGKPMMWLDLFILIIGLFRLFSKPRRSITRFAGYDILLPSLSQSGRRHFNLGRYSFAFSFSQSPICIEEHLPILQIPLYCDPLTGRPSSYVMGTFHRVRNRIRMVGARFSPPNSPHQPSQGNRGVLFFLPAVFTTHSSDMELQPAARPRATRTASTSVSRHRNRSPRSEKEDLFQRDAEIGLMQSSDNQEVGLGLDDIHEFPQPIHGVAQNCNRWT